ncbi:hypothetical protein EJ02DRAFT_470182 [Clathrospora elynae]|uniref:Uncharacterized protein n=1 Tax=Clathrospora elynae TaxID=706981 RepID=A0A6A5SA55_9PLEO|nr:hypothetical protein EJ02DRAFT_470182 [Clathrospora elynae]
MSDSHESSPRPNTVAHPLSPHETGAEKAAQEALYCITVQLQPQCAKVQSRCNDVGRASSALLHPREIAGADLGRFITDALYLMKEANGLTARTNKYIQRLEALQEALNKVKK